MKRTALFLLAGIMFMLAATVTKAGQVDTDVGKQFPKIEKKQSISIDVYDDLSVPVVSQDLFAEPASCNLINPVEYIPPEGQPGFKSDVIKRPVLPVTCINTWWRSFHRRQYLTDILYL